MGSQGLDGGIGGKFAGDGDEGDGEGEEFDSVLDEKAYLKETHSRVTDPKALIDEMKSSGTYKEEWNRKLKKDVVEKDKGKKTKSPGRRK